MGGKERGGGGEKVRGEGRRGRVKRKERGRETLRKEKSERGETVEICTGEGTKQQQQTGPRIQTKSRRRNINRVSLIQLI